ncbi:spermatogenesis-associated protein 1 isoform X1 [Astatotilapia calliptera]|uniref:Spermatogenesis-associated protein 1 C-terminal domain-containing protein n=2 Tax=Haplochromini TaxID=319058 RepID=A0AAX7TJB7_ASTCA|nr:spermatogenesis-associated protein 1 isoform X1 [Astatotilapia calliptera]XP_025998086.1 spermatogenesis-associated protein 1 isoform X1 [Astatotilapia calliptera]XP_025998087.1 spermatogenesis-associated protein 1 isoform X1 [Astatotilapia calliptera]
MELSCASARYTEDRRPHSCKLLELHVLFVPADQWNVKLNKVSAEATESFISAGFIRVYPDVTLKTLRSELGALLGAQRSVNKFSFLKCVGRSLALVKSKQEQDLKVKVFAPPYQATQPELYLLPAVENDSSVCSRSLTPDTTSTSPDHQIYYHPPKTCSRATGTKEPTKFPHIPQYSHQPPPTHRLEEEEEEGDDRSYSSSEGGGEKEGETLSSIRRAEQECFRGQKQRAPQLALHTPQLQGCRGGDFQQCVADSAQVKELPEKEETCRKKKHNQRGNRAARHSGVAESLEDRDSGFSLTDGVGKSKVEHALKSIRNNRTARLSESLAPLSQPAVSPPSGLDLATVTHETAASPVLHTNREELISEIQLVREERKQLERRRQELLRKGKDLLAQNRHRRNQARDSWKKKYFEAKKATAPLDENLRNLRQELETFYNKVLHQLQARDNRAKPRHQGRSSMKNELIIQIMTESHEIDNLKRKVEDGKMKLVTEIKLRKQAATELRALKAELAQKKSQSSHPGLMGNTPRHGAQVQSSAAQFRINCT